MALYVKVFTAFFTNRKTIRLRALIGDAALWLPIRIWAYAAENQQDGDFTGYSEHELAMLVGYSGDATSMREALHKAGFMEEMRIHGWEEYNEYHAEFKARAKAAADVRWQKHRARKEKKQKKEDTNTEEERIGAKQCLTHASSMDEVVEFTKSLGLPGNDGAYFWEKWQGNGNQNAGKSIKDWKSVIRSWKLAGHCPSQKLNGQINTGNGFHRNGDSLKAHERASGPVVPPDGFAAWLTATYPGKAFGEATRATQEDLVKQFRSEK